MSVEFVESVNDNVGLKRAIFPGGKSVPAELDLIYNNYWTVSYLD